MPATIMSEFVRPSGEFLDPMIRNATEAAKQLHERWDRAVHDAAGSRRLPELHATRDGFRALLEGHIRLLEELRSMAALDAAEPELFHHHDLDDGLAGLQKFHDELFPRWNTLDDFYKIALDVVSIPAARLDEIAKKNPPPQSWYDETINPFEAE